jgi:hypothetical protein
MVGIVDTGGGAAVRTTGELGVELAGGGDAVAGATSATGAFALFLDDVVDDVDD